MHSSKRLEDSLSSVFGGHVGSKHDRLHVTQQFYGLIELC